MSGRPTPETDAEHAQFAMGGFTLDFCRKLERERDEAREAIMIILEENRHLADGDDCTLAKLKSVVPEWK